MAKHRGLIGLLLALALVAAGWFLWDQRARTRRAEAEAGLASARVLESVFRETRELQVARLTGRASARSHDDGWIDSDQVTRAPFAVSYTIDLRGLDAGSYHWNAAQRTMTVDVPRVAVGAPAIDMTRAEISQDGWWISRRAGLALQRQGAVRLRNVAATEANKPENVARAQGSARAAVTRLVAAPLAAAGMDDVRVVVRLPGESKPAALTDEQWDVSTSIADIYARYAGG